MGDTPQGEAEVTIPDMKTGYVTGITTEGEFFWAPIGTEKSQESMLTLLGVTEIAREIIETHMAKAIGLGATGQLDALENKVDAVATLLATIAMNASQRVRRHIDNSESDDSKE